MEFPTEPGLVWPSPRTFFGAPRCDDLSELAADVAFLGVPYDAGTLQPYIRTGQSGGRHSHGQRASTSSTTHGHRRRGPTEDRSAVRYRVRSRSPRRRTRV